MKEITNQTLMNQLHKRLAMDVAFINETIDFWGASLINQVLIKVGSEFLIDDDMDKEGTLDDNELSEGHRSPSQ